MSDKDRKCWSEILPFLFNLLVENADRIVDDTSLERILEWLKNVCGNEQELQKLLQCGTLEFMAREQVFSNPQSAAFFLKLFGFLVEKAEIFNSFNCGQHGDVLSKFLDKPRTEPCLWNEGIVRNGYFQALISLTEHKDGVVWLGGTGHIDCALECITDRSMFVAKAAQSLIAKYLIRQIDWIFCTNSEERSNNTVENNKLIHVTDRLRSMLNSESTASKFLPVAVLEVSRILLFEGKYSGQKVLQESKLFPLCLDLIKVGDAAICEKLVDVLCEFAKTARMWEVDWDGLFSTEESSASDVLLGSCVDLFKKGLTLSGLELVSGLAFCQGNSRVFPHHWLEVLFDIVELPFELSLNLPCCDNGELQNGCYTVIDGETQTTELVDGLISNDKQKKSVAKGQLQCILLPWIKGSCSLTPLICQALATAKLLIGQASSAHYSYVLCWLKHSVGLLQQFISPNIQSTFELHNNQKVLKACFEFISSFTEIEKSKGILKHTDSCTVDQLFNDVVITLLQLIESSGSSATVISSSLKTFGKVLDIARPDFISKLFSCEASSEDIPRKQARLDSSVSWDDFHPNTTGVEAGNSEKLAFVLFQRLRDSRWEVKDSTLEFVASLLRVNHDSIHDFLCRHNIHAMVWNATEDSDSYVRATAINVIGSLVCQSQLWASLLQTSHLSEESILEKLSSILESDDEAFPRRRAIECFTLWVKTRHPMREKILFGKRYHLDFTNTSRDFIAPPTMRADVELLPAEDISDQSLSEGIPKCDDFQKLRVVSQFERKRAPTVTIRSVCHACKDFDWEVKVRGLEFWGAVIDSFSCFQMSKESTNFRREAGLSFGETVDWSNKLKAGNTDELFELLFDMGTLDILNEALHDCDLMVCEKGLELLASLQNILNPEGNNTEQSIKTSMEFQETLGKNFNLDKFREVLRATDFPTVTQSTEAADNLVRANPVSFIEDILSAAVHQVENLLDCY